jgi:hypothetical protein
MSQLLVACMPICILCAMQFSIQELDVFVYTVEEVNLDSLEKHILMWKVDLVENRINKDVKNIGWIVLGRITR